MKLLKMRFSPAFYFFLFLESKCFPQQHPVPEHLNLCPCCERFGLTATFIWNIKQKQAFIYFILNVFINTYVTKVSELSNAKIPQI